jgi:hypothetical protein
MTEAGIGRVLVASLHQGIADILPTRLDFYENWLNPNGLRHGTIGLAPLQAVLSFLRLEGEPYGIIVQRAGRYAAEWTVASQRPLVRSFMRRLPLNLRARAVLRLAARTIHESYVGSRGVLRLRAGQGRLDVRASLFCGIRDSSAEPLCGFYSALVSRFLELYRVPGRVDIGECRAVGDRSCVLTLEIGQQVDEAAPGEEAGETPASA